MQCAVYTLSLRDIHSTIYTCKRNQKVRPHPTPRLLIPYIQWALAQEHLQAKHIQYQWMNNMISGMFRPQGSSSATKLKKSDVQMDFSTATCESRQKHQPLEYSHAQLHFFSSSLYVCAQACTCVWVCECVCVRAVCVHICVCAVCVHMHVLCVLLIQSAINPPLSSSSPLCSKFVWLQNAHKHFQCPRAGELHICPGVYWWRPGEVPH